MTIERIGIVGGGAWGTALATVAARTGRSVLVWAREPEVVEAINRDHENTVFLPGVTLDPAIAATADLAAMGALDALLMVTPPRRWPTSPRASPRRSTPPCPSPCVPRASSSRPAA